MALNHYFSQKVRSEQQLYEDLIIESLKIYGQDVYYLPRTIVNQDRLLGEDIPSKFGSAYKVEMYIENTEGFDGEGDLFTRFGVEIRDAATFIVSRRRWEHVFAQAAFPSEATIGRPKEGDVIYLPLSNSMFQIMHVEHEQPFYQLSNLPTYKMRCELFDYSDEDFDTGVAAIDAVENEGQTLSFLLAAGTDSNVPDFFKGEFVKQRRADGVTMRGEVLSYDRSANIVKVTHIGPDSGGFGTFQISKTVADSFYNTWLINDRVETPFQGITADSDPRRQILSIADSTAEDLINSQNKVFNAADGNSLFDYSFLDFTEKNPFGDAEDN